MYGSDLCPDMYARPASHIGRHAISFCQVHERVCWGSQHVFLLLCRVSPISVRHGEPFLTGICSSWWPFLNRGSQASLQTEISYMGALARCVQSMPMPSGFPLTMDKTVVWWKLICLYCRSICASWRIYVMWFFRYPMRSFCISCNENMQTSHPSICKSHEVIHNLIFRSQYSFPIQPWWFCWPGLWEERQ